VNAHQLDREASTEDRIIAATLRLIAEDGLGSVSMRRVAETAGVARQTLYNHYPDVDSIVATAISRHHDENIQMLDAALRVVDDPAGKLEQLVRHVVSIGAHAHHAPGIESGLSADARATLRECDDAVEQRIREILQAGQRTGAFRSDLSPDVDTALIRHMFNALAERSAANPDRTAEIADSGGRTVIAAVVQH
jgi:AcrR family transcriptional regulator